MAQGTNVHLLENQSCTIGDVLFLGATLWTDFALNGEPVLSEVVAQTTMNDYRRIRTLPRYSRLKPSDTRRFHMESRRWLEDEAFANNGQKVCGRYPQRRASLHSGCGEEIPRNPAFASLGRFIVESEARLWVHGHIHFCCDYALGKTRVLAQPARLSHGVENGFQPRINCGGVISWKRKQKTKTPWT